MNRALIKSLLAELIDCEEHSQPSQATEFLPFAVGKSYFIRTVTYHQVGRVRAVVGGFLILDDASWVADSGRFMDALKSGKLNEVEPMGDGIIVNMSSICDAAPWAHALPKDQK